MKLSFTTKGWDSVSFDEFCRIACDTGFQGIELYGIDNPMFTSRGGPFSEYSAAATVRKMHETGLSIPCIDAVCDISAEDADAAAAHITECIKKASELRIPYVRVHAAESEDAAAAAERSRALIGRVIGAAEEKNVGILVETCGIFSDTLLLKDTLDTFACDSVGALWDLHNPARFRGESAEETIKNLGAYVRHVHVKDSEGSGENLAYCLIGEGELPIDELIDALRSINYDGFISLEWDVAWLPELADMDIIFSHFVSCMSRFGDTSEADEVLYQNRAGTGNFIWKKETLVDLTFSQMLDEQVKHFPDQYAFRYTTLDYTRTYAEFSRDVDEFARALIALGVKRGDKVAIWATNIPQWYITFWATTKIGAVLVTVNTAYKIHEAEYLFRQSDTHTLVMIDGYRDSDYSSIIGELCPELEHTKSGTLLHARRLPFLRNVITVGFRKRDA